MRIITVEREVWYEEGTDWKSLLRKDERLLSATVEYDPTRPAYNEPLFCRRVHPTTINRIVKMRTHRKEVSHV